MRIYNTKLFYSMLGMFIWSVLVMLRNLQVRVAAVKRGELTNKYFELFVRSRAIGIRPKDRQSFQKSDRAAAAVLYHLFGHHVYGPHGRDFIMLAWSYVALRIGHSLIHLTFNKVPPRFVPFAASVIVLVIMWLRLAVVL